MKKILIILSVLFCTTVFAHTIEWYVGDTLLSTTTCESGDNITPPTAPEKFGYHFVEWNPIEYLEYIEGEQNVQYIDTNVILTSDMNIYAKFGVALVGNSYMFPFGTRTASGGNDGLICVISGSSFDLRWFGSVYQNTASITKNDILEISIGNNIGNVKKNNVNLYSISFSPNTDCQYSLFINAINNAGSIMSNYTSGMFRQYRFTVEGIADMRPARRVSDGAVGMYDTIRKQFFTNAGTGQFIAGPIINE